MMKKRSRILVIDDAHFNQVLFSKALGTEFDIQLASSGMEGLAMAEASPPDLILLDVRMPEIDGFETCRRLKAHSELQDIPVIFVTGEVDPVSEVKGLALGAVDYVHKPFKIAITTQRIRNLLDRECLRKQFEAKRQKLEALIKAIPDLLFEVDRQGTYLSIWAQDETLLAHQQEVLLGRTVSEMLPTEAASICMEAIEEADLTGSCYGKRIHLLVDNRPKWFELSVSKENNNDYALARFVVLSRDITERYEAEERILHLALHDVLTGLPNRALLIKLTEKAISSARRTQQQFALIFIDLDKFKPVNDNFGHAVGDLLLKEVALRICQAIRESDTVARIGGDEFLILVNNIQGSEDAVTVAEKVRMAIGEPFLINGHSHLISASFGISNYPEHGEEIVDLLKNADEAMYVAKNEGRDRVSTYMTERNPHFEAHSLD